MSSIAAPVVSTPTSSRKRNQRVEADAAVTPAAKKCKPTTEETEEEEGEDMQGVEASGSKVRAESRVAVKAGKAAKLQQKVDTALVYWMGFFGMVLPQAAWLFSWQAFDFPATFNLIASFFVVGGNTQVTDLKGSTWNLNLEHKVVNLLRQGLTIPFDRHTFVKVPGSNRRVYALEFFQPPMEATLSRLYKGLRRIGQGVGLEFLVMPTAQDLLVRASLDVCRSRGDEVLEEIRKWLRARPFVKDMELCWEAKDDILSGHVLVNLHLKVPLQLVEDETWDDADWAWVRIILARPWTKEMRVSLASFFLFAELVTLTTVATCTACGALDHRLGTCPLKVTLESGEVWKPFRPARVVELPVPTPSAVGAEPSLSRSKVKKDKAKKKATEKAKERLTFQGSGLEFRVYVQGSGLGVYRSRALV